MTENLLKFDREHIWHPYTSTTNPLPTSLVKRAYGCNIELADGTKLIDGMSSWWAVIHGYNHPTLNKAVNEQVKNMSHIMFGGLTHEPAIYLAKKLISISPKGLEKVFFSDSGSVAVEVAMKMALQYQHSKGNSNKNKFVTIKSGYHGDTWNAMSVCDPVTGMHHIFKHSLTPQLFAEQPKTRFEEKWDNNDIQSLKQIIDEHHKEIAGLIIEPIVQGAGGMWFYSPKYLETAYKICKENDILVIFDEIATGFGRTGKLFATEHTNISPDIMCIGKAITGGYMSFAATLSTNNVAKTISNGEAGVFMHGPTFMGNPLACAVANASIDLLLSQDWQSKVMHIETFLKDNLEECNKFKSIKDVRVLGAIGVVETKNNVDVSFLQKQFVKQGVWIRPFKNLIYIMPPYIINDDELKKLTDAVNFIVKTL